MTHPKDPARSTLHDLYERTRQTTLRLTEPLTPEDCVVQSMPDVSPTKWHLAHTAWFFETFVLAPGLPGYTSPSPHYAFLFNSYYEAVGPRHARHARGVLTRPTWPEVISYRRHVDDAMRTLFDRAPEAGWREVSDLIVLGINHEEQHQELLLMDIKHVLSQNPMHPAYRSDLGAVRVDEPSPRTWIEHDGGLVEVGFSGGGFAFDNEGPRHRVFLAPYRLASRMVTAGEYLAWVESGGYRQPEHWLSDGWAKVQAEGWTAPLYWEQEDGAWYVYTLAGRVPLHPAAPVVHLSYYEADAYARSVGARLPTEHEWEHAAAQAPLNGRFLEHSSLHPRPAEGPESQLFGDAWEWTASPFTAYPGYQPPPGAVGEYNGKFMVNQMVLRGGACVTPMAHARATYRNFYYPHQRWMFSGMRLAL